MAFQTGEIIYTNKIANLSGFIPSIDNLTNNVKDVHSCMIVPIYGHKELVNEAGKTKNKQYAES